MVSACERPFIEVSTPGIEILEPDLSTVFLDPNLEIAVSANSFRPVERVMLNGSPMTLNANRDLWEISYELGRGLNTLVIEAIDTEGTVGADTAYAVHYSYQFALNAPRLPRGRGGHTTTLLRGGALLVVGGASQINGPAQGDAFLLSPSGTFFQTLNARLEVARTGHTATRLPDDRVLILGGSRSEAIGSVDNLVETVEIFDPETLTFQTIPFEGQPIRRALHTAVLRNTAQGVFIDLYGGRGDIRYGAEPRLGTRSDLRIFELVNDTLFARNTLASAPDLEAAIFGHTETLTQLGTYLVFGSFFSTQSTDEVSFRVDYTSPLGLDVTDVPPLPTPRTRHAAATLGNGFLVLFGGHRASPFDIVDETELYHDRAERFFRFPNVQQTVKRFGHTATNLSSQRILLVGGFGPDGNSFSASEFFDVSLAN